MLSTHCPSYTLNFQQKFCHAPVISHFQKICDVRVIWLRNRVRADFRGRGWLIDLHPLTPESNVFFLAT
jgi:hypothetical protein